MTGLPVSLLSQANTSVQDSPRALNLIFLRGAFFTSGDLFDGVSVLLAGGVSVLVDGGSVLVDGGVSVFGGGWSALLMSGSLPGPSARTLAVGRPRTPIPRRIRTADDSTCGLAVNARMTCFLPLVANRAAPAHANQVAFGRPGHPPPVQAHNATPIPLRSLRSANTPQLHERSCLRSRISSSQDQFVAAHCPNQLPGVQSSKRYAQGAFSSSFLTSSSFSGFARASNSDPPVSMTKKVLSLQKYSLSFSMRTTMNRVISLPKVSRTIQRSGASNSSGLGSVASITFASLAPGLTKFASKPLRGLLSVMLSSLTFFSTSSGSPASPRDFSSSFFSGVSRASSRLEPMGIK